jgi:hypothetical protein
MFNVLYWVSVLSVGMINIILIFEATSMVKQLEVIPNKRDFNDTWWWYL